MNEKIERAVQDLDKNGIAVIPDFLTTEEMQEMKDAIKKLIEENQAEVEKKMFDGTIEFNDGEYKFGGIDKIRFYYEREAFDERSGLKYGKEGSLFRIGFALHVLHPVFKKITNSQKVKDVCQKLGYKEPKVVQGMYIFKNPYIGGVSLPHQDRTFLMVSGDDPKEVGFWMPLEDATVSLGNLAILIDNFASLNNYCNAFQEENGCLWYIPGSHKTGLHRKQILHPEKGLIFTNDCPNYDEKSFVPAPAKKGSCVLIHGLVVHKSEPNRSKHPRPAYTFHLYDGATCKWDQLNSFNPTEVNPFPNLYENWVLY